MIYALMHVAFALWVAFDGFSRKVGRKTVLWGIGTLFLLPLVLPIYLAVRPLKNRETRAGGFAWNSLKNFAILWTFMIAFATVTWLMNEENIFLSMTPDAARIGMTRAIRDALGLWFLLAGGATLIGFLLKNESVVETGPNL